MKRHMESQQPEAPVWRQDPGQGPVRPVVWVSLALKEVAKMALKSCGEETKINS